MERIVRIVTKNLVSRLPSEQEFYRPEQLRALNIPDFIVDRVIIEMERNIDDTITLPYTEWADIKHRHVQDAWSEFTEVIRSEARLPNAYAASVIESAVSDSLDILLQPRKNIPLMIFGSERALDLKTLEDRSESVVVYKHLAAAPVKYMDRKQLDAISFEQCCRIIETVDEKIVSRYNSLSWAQLLEPLFLLLGDSIDTNLLRIFFRDKQRPRIARMFDEMNSSISRSGIIEALSSPELLEDAGESDPRDKAYVAESAIQKKEVPITGKSESGEPKPGLKMNDIREAEADEEDIPLHSRFMFDETATGDDSESDEPDNSALSFYEMFRPAEELDDEVDDPAENLITGNFFSDSNTNKEDEEFKVEPAEDEQVRKPAEPVENATGESPENPESEELNDDGRDSGLMESFEIDEDLVKKFEKLSKSKSEKNSDDDDSKQADERQIRKDTVVEDSESAEEEKKDTYIWKHFLADEFEEDNEYDSDGNEDETAGIFEFPEEVNEPDNQLVTDEHLPERISLIEWMDDDAARFTKEIFNGSERAFVQAVNEITDVNDWKQATRYIEKEIFLRNNVDLYDEVAVDFTDKLHSYFMELNNNKAES
jgi:hypothetical protein